MTALTSRVDRSRAEAGPTSGPAGEATGAGATEPGEKGADQGAIASVGSATNGLGHRRMTFAAWAALGMLLLGTAVLYLVGLDKSGYANSFYSAAVQAGSVSWKAMFFGASDAAGSITVDKTPLALWPMALSVRLFGLSSWSILAPQALMGVATVGVLFDTVRRRFGTVGGFIAGAVLALTPVAALMFRFNNPDALLVLLMTAAVWTGLRAVDNGRWRWVLATGALLGLGFLAKQLQVLLVLPALAITYLVAGPRRFVVRVGQLLGAGAAMVASAGWYIALVELWPATSRPYIGGSQGNSLLELTLGYNGLGRITGNQVGAVIGGNSQPQAGSWGATGITRMFDAAQGGQISWLVPAALVATAAGLAAAGLRRRTDARRASFLVWGLWLLVTGLTFSFMAGIFHSYYTVALAPAVGALVGMGSVLFWEHRRAWVARLVAAATVAGTGAWAYVLLTRSASSFMGGLQWVVLGAGAVGAVALVAGRWWRAASVAGLVLAAVAGLAGPVVYTGQTVATGHSGSIVSAGPMVAGAMGGPGGMRGGPRTGAGGQFPGPPPGMTAGQTPDGQTPNGQASTGQPSAGQVPTGQPAAGGAPTGGQAGAMPAPPTGGRGDGGPGAGGGGGLLDSRTTSAAVKAKLLEDADRYTWVAATTGSQNASGYQLATEKPVMPIGGFNGSDPSPTLAQFQRWVKDGKIHYYIVGGGPGGGGPGGGGPGGGGDGGQVRGAPGGGPGGSATNTSSQISTWVAEHYTAVTVDGVTMYDLTAPKA